VTTVSHRAEPAAPAEPTRQVRRVLVGLVVADVQIGVVVDGTRLWLRFVDNSESRAPVIEHVTTAVASELTQRWPGVDPVWAARVAAGMVAAAVLLDRRTGRSRQRHRLPRL
jgi:hypothetical protein